MQSSGDPPELKHYGKRSLASDSITEQKFSAANNKNSEQLNGGRIWVVTVTYMAVHLVLLNVWETVSGVSRLLRGSTYFMSLVR